MKYRDDGYNWIVRLEKGEQFVATLTKFIKDNDVPTCWISAIGAVTSVELGFYDLPNKTYNWQRFDELMEITSLNGNIAWVDGEPNLHVHGTFSKSDYSVVGGHVKDFTVGGTCEIFLHKLDFEKLTRTHSDEIGLNLLDI